MDYKQQVPITEFGRFVNKLIKLEMIYNTNVERLKRQTATTEKYANLWNEGQLALHRANVRIKRLEEKCNEKET